MPFKAYCQDNELISFTLSDSEWSRISSKEVRRDLRMACCDSKAIPKESKLGTRFFSHHIRTGCEYKKETPEHLAAKKIVFDACRAEGWSTSTEVSGNAPNGKRWIADVLSERGVARIAFEIQWSWQSMEDFRERQAIYKDSEVRCAWFFRLRKVDSYCDDKRLDLKSNHINPLFGIKSLDGDFVLPHANNMRLFDFTRALLRGEIGYWPRQGAAAELRFYAFSGSCPSCKRNTRHLAKIDIIDIAYRSKFGKERSIYLTENEETHLFKLADWNLPQGTFGDVISKPRLRSIKTMPYSNVNRSYHKQMINVCSHCSASLPPDPYCDESDACETTPFHVCKSLCPDSPAELASWYVGDVPMWFSKSE